MFFKNKIDITVLITSINQRNITIDTANYYSEICSEVVIVDEEQPYLSIFEIGQLKKKGITYIGFKADNYDNPIKSVYQKRLIAAKESNNRHVVHSNHDERYTYHGLLACISELDNNKDLTFCAGQAIAIRKAGKEIYYTISYKKLFDYHNIRKVNQRIYHHSNVYLPMAHYAVWKKESYIKTKELTISVYEAIHSRITFCEEVIFELAADLAGNSKTTTDLYWVRNRINVNYYQQEFKNGEYAFKDIKNKLKFIFQDLDNINFDVIIKNLLNNFPSLRSKTFIERSVISIKMLMSNFIRKKTMKRKEGVDDIFTLLNDNKIKYEKNDVNNLINSMRL